MLFRYLRDSLRIRADTRARFSVHECDNTGIFVSFERARQFGRALRDQIADTVDIDLP